jgi:hypothetical protein
LEGDAEIVVDVDELREELGISPDSVCDTVWLPLSDTLDVVVTLLLAVGVCTSVFVFVAVDSPDCDCDEDADAEIVVDVDELREELGSSPDSVCDTVWLPLNETLPVPVGVRICVLVLVTLWSPVSD